VATQRSPSILSSSFSRTEQRARFSSRSKKKNQSFSISSHPRAPFLVPDCRRGACFVPVSPLSFSLVLPRICGRCTSLHHVHLPHPTLQQPPNPALVGSWCLFFSSHQPRCRLRCPPSRLSPLPSTMYEKGLILHPPPIFYPSAISAQEFRTHPFLLVVILAEPASLLFLPPHPPAAQKTSLPLRPYHRQLGRFGLSLLFLSSSRSGATIRRPIRPRCALFQHTNRATPPFSFHFFLVRKARNSSPSVFIHPPSPLNSKDVSG